VVVIPKSADEFQVMENSEVFDFQLSDEEMKSLEGMNRNFRFIQFTDALDHPQHPFKIPYH